MNTEKDFAEVMAQLQRLRLLSLLEGATLLVLVLVAVPLRHIGGMRAATAIAGPVHGMVFLLYVWTLLQTAAAGCLPDRCVSRMIAAAFIPLGGFVNARTLRTVQAALAASRSRSPA